MTNRAHAIDDRAEAHARPDRALPAGTRLREYEIAAVLVETGFDIVYLANDSVLQRQVALKEYLPMSLAGRMAGSAAVVVTGERQREAFKAGLRSFVAEAKLLARFDHPSLVKVYRFWEENGTAYRVMPLYEGPTLESALATLDHVPSEAELRTWLRPVLDGLAVLHDGDALHQNIGPDTIVLTPIGPVLFGLGAAEQAIASLLHTPASSLKPGYAAVEQYGSVAETKRGPWTDLYALAAVIYSAITGAPPPPAADRLAHDTMRPISVVAAGLYGEGFLAAIDAALAIEPERRPASHLRFRALMGDIDAPAPVELAPHRDLMHEPFAAAPTGEREITVPDHPLLALGEAAGKPSAAKATSTTATAPAPTAPKPARSRRAAASSAADAAPAWNAGSSSGGLFGKRALYGLVAGTCVLIGVGALGLQFYARQAGRTITPTTTPTTTSSTPAVIPAPATTALPTPASPTPSPVAASTTARSTAPTARAAAASGTGSDEIPEPATPAERSARCSDILQKASLERISPAETNFFKRECK